METRIFDTVQALASAECDRIAALLEKKPTALLCIAAGHTSLPVCAELTARVQRGEIEVSGARFVAMDEWLGMNRHTPGSCGDFLEKNLLSRVKFAQVCLFDGCAEDTQAECEAVMRFIDGAGGLDYILLGMGMNGHLALNEPGVAFTAHAHVTGLDPVTAKVGQKYFENGAALSGGLTLGIADIARAGEVSLHVTGEKKAGIVRRLMEEPVSNRLPATALKEMPQARIWLDRAAAGEC